MITKISTLTIFWVSCLFLTIAVAAQEPAPFDEVVDADLYVIRPGDQLIVTFLKSKVAALTLTVDPEGRVVHETIGILRLAGKTLNEAKTTVKEIIQPLYNVADIAISTSGPRLVSITVLGAVREPGNYRGYTSQRVSEIIELAGGILPDGSRRWIEFSGGPNSLRVDLDRAKYLGDKKADPFIYAGNTIVVPNRSGKLIQVVGEVNTPREIELIAGDDLSILLALAGGTRAHADTAAIEILGRGQPSTIGDLNHGDIIVVPAKKPGSEENRLAIFGAVHTPGFYPYSDGIMLADLVAKAGGFSEDANSRLATVFRRPRFDATGRVSETRFPVSHLLTNGDDMVAMKMQAADSVFVPVLVGFVKVTGEVLNPGYYPFVRGQSGTDYINAAGGFLPAANKVDIAVYQPVSGVTSVVSPGVLLSDGCEMIVSKREELK